ncbi:aldo/keto reductase [Rhizobium wenxiniae]|uniref:aldo/keto reductase n=1 Tax=Rhizobium wenxiniae TaxID=1737357 RepID=UPI001C6F4010|nr:aldo/keto reductase [Rhizobium wenxiniae]MBW9089771.1 aldo/keto reductase [Rhizobium wenxiniae]
MNKRQLEQTNLSIAPLVLGSNVFGWTIDEQASFAVLDSFIEYGFNAIDTADVYSAWIPGNCGGEAETIIGRWLKARPGVRDKVVIFTKVGGDLGRPGETGLSERWINKGVEASLSRLGVEAIDLLFSHIPDAGTPYEETLAAYAGLLKAGKIRAIGASNHDAVQLEEALTVADRTGLPRYQVLQPEYNLYDRASFEGPLRNLSVAQGLGVVTYFSLASGFLTGKYRQEADLDGTARSGMVGKYLNAKGKAILQGLDEVADAHRAKPVEVALAWLMARQGVTAPIASATSPSHVKSFASAVDLHLSDDETILLEKAGG